MSLAPWMSEWVKFDSQSVKDMKRHSDNTHTHREWMCYVYEQDYGVLVPSGGPMPVLLEESEGETAIFKDPAEAENVARRSVSPRLTMRVSERLAYVKLHVSQRACRSRMPFFRP